MRKPTMHRYQPTDSPADLERLHFRCIEPTQFRLSSGEIVTVQANGWLLAAKELPPTDEEATRLRFYHIYYASGETELLDEADVINLVGATAFTAVF